MPFVFLLFFALGLALGIYIGIRLAARRQPAEDQGRLTQLEQELEASLAETREARQESADFRYRLGQIERDRDNLQRRLDQRDSED